MEKELDIGRKEAWPYLKKASDADLQQVIRTVS